jgi:HrpA-like RNA helicase
MQSQVFNKGIETELTRELRRASKMHSAETLALVCEFADRRKNPRHDGNDDNNNNKKENYRNVKVLSYHPVTTRLLSQAQRSPAQISPDLSVTTTFCCPISHYRSPITHEKRIKRCWIEKLKIETCRIHHKSRSYKA